MVSDGNDHALREYRVCSERRCIVRHASGLGYISSVSLSKSFFEAESILCGVIVCGNAARLPAALYILQL
jgi:hypothetical protein